MIWSWISFDVVWELLNFVKCKTDFFVAELSNIPHKIHINWCFNSSFERWIGGNWKLMKLSRLIENLMNEFSESMWCIFIATLYHYSSGIMMRRYEPRWRNVNIWVFLTLTRRRLSSFHHSPLWVIINFAKTRGNVVEFLLTSHSPFIFHSLHQHYHDRLSTFN